MITAQDGAAIRPGKLRIFLGYAPGVGKTYAMLDEGRQRLIEGVDVVIGAVDAEPELLDGFEITDPALNVEAILRRQPQLVLIDDLAHINIHQDRHPFRFQDVDEILSAGIDVYATVNLQYIESLNDIVFQITGIKEFRTVPDTILDRANELEVVDLPVDDLLKRYETGVIPLSDIYQRHKLFRAGNLHALRELALRYTARHVDRNMQDYMQRKAIAGPWAAGERLLVGIGPSPFSTRLIRAACRLSQDLNAEWHAVYVEHSGQALKASDHEQLAQNMQLAEKLGAKVVSVPGNSIPQTLLSYARDHNITKIIIGHPRQSRLMELLRGSIAQQLVENSGDIDLYVVSSGNEAAPAANISLPSELSRRAVVEAVLLIALATLGGLLMQSMVTSTNLVMLYLLTVVVVAVRSGYGPAVMTSFLSVLVFNYFFVPPQYTFRVAEAEYLLTFAGLFVVGFVIADLTGRVRRQADVARQRENQTAELYSLSRDLAATVDPQLAMEAIINHVQQTFHSDSAIFLKDHGELKLYVQTPSYHVNLDESEMVQYVVDYGKPAGAGTDTRPLAESLYLPLQSAYETFGVLAVRTSGVHNPSQKRLMEAFAHQAALAIEATRLADKAQQAQLLKEREKLHNTLLNSISHDLRTPLVSITGALSSLRDEAVYVDASARQDLLEGAYQEANRLNRLVGNLLEITRLQAGTVKLNRELFSVEEIIGVARRQLSERLSSRPIHVDIADDLPLVAVDLVLMSQVLINLLDNALKYSPPEKPIEIRSFTQDNKLVLQVNDYGIGIPEDELPHIFEKFFRSHNTSGTTGTGLGLSICEGIVSAHGGTISAQNREAGGTCFQIMLPLDESDR
ncbi:MAG: sensor histidine kinase KdpD [Chloroflexi bacterium]|nr:sensor histidine kinase KdpD [Chloroflexota bacterium]